MKTSQIESLNIQKDTPQVVTVEIDRVEKLNREADTRWAQRLQVDTSLTRAVVSFQANKSRSIYRWFKYKEAFSAS